MQKQYQLFDLHRRLLPEKDKFVYDRIRKAIIKMEITVEFHGGERIAASHYYDILRGVINDDPLLFFVKKEITTTSYRDHDVIELDYFETAKSRDELRNKVHEYLKHIDVEVVKGCKDQTSISE